MDEFLTDEERWEQIKDWFKKYAMALIVIAALAVAVVFGHQYWQRYQSQQNAQVSIAFDNLIRSLGQNDAEKAELYAMYLLKNFQKSTYAQFAAMILGGQAVLKNDLLEAKKQLAWVIERAKNNHIQHLAMMRMARILIAEGNAKKALDLLAGIDDKGYSLLLEEVRGDAYQALSNIDMAKKSYASALELAKKEKIQQPLLKMKYDNLQTKGHL